MKNASWHPSLRFYFGGGTALLRGLAAEPTTHKRFRFELALLDFELAENRLEADKKLVPLILNVAQRAFAHLAEKANGGRRRHEAMNILTRHRTAIDGVENQFEFLGDNALDFKELVFVL